MQVLTLCRQAGPASLGHVAIDGTKVEANASKHKADAGYCSEANLRKLNRRHVRGYVATGRKKHGNNSNRSRLGQTSGTATYAMRPRIAKAGFRSRYRLREQVVEPVLGFTRFRLRGLNKVRYEWGLVCLASNLRKLARCELSALPGDVRLLLEREPGTRDFGHGHGRGHGHGGTSPRKGTRS